MCQCLSKQNLGKRNRHPKRHRRRRSPRDDDMNVDSDDDDYDKYYRKLTQCRHRMSKSSISNNEQTESNFQPSPTVKFSMSKLYKSTSSMRSKKKFEYKIRMSPSLKADLPSCDIKTIPVLKDTLRPIRSSIFEWRVGKTKQDSKMVDDKQQKLVDVVIERLLRQKLDENYMLLNKKTSSPNRKRRKRKKTSKRKKRSKPRRGSPNSPEKVSSSNQSQS